jgi:hypothetical protein
MSGSATRSRSALSKPAIERVGRGAPGRSRVGKRRDDVEELDDRPGPPVDQHERRGVGLGRAHVQEVQVLPVDRGVNWGTRLSRASCARQS